MAELATHDVIPAMAGGSLRQPLQRFFVGADQHHIRAPAVPPVGQHRCAAEHHRVARRRGFAQRGHALQVRIDRDHRVEQVGQEPANDALAHHLARMKGNVLAHAGEIRRHQRQLPRVQLARGPRHQQQLDQFFVWVGQGAPDHHKGRQRLGDHSAEELAAARRPRRSIFHRLFAP
jgi:hypothetical protein